MKYCKLLVKKKTFYQFVSERAGTYILAANLNEQFLSPSDIRLPVVNAGSQKFESYLSEVFKFLHKTHVKYVRTLQFIFYLKPATNIHKFISHVNGFTGANLSLSNLEMVIYFTNYRYFAFTSSYICLSNLSSFL